MNDLLACPFCGSNKVQLDTDVTDFCAWCRECDFTSRFYNNKEKAIAAWNRRTPSPKLELPQEVREAVYKCVECGSTDCYRL